MTTEYLPPDRFTPAAMRLARDPHNADLRKDAQREDLLYDTIDHTAREINRRKRQLVDVLEDATGDVTVRLIRTVSQQAYTAEVEYGLWQMVVQSSGPAMREPLEALRDTVRWAQGQALDALEDNSTDLTDARIYARWARMAEELMK